jgi:hypothetical protein
LASGDSFTYEHRSRYSDLGKILFSIDGKVSPSHLLQVRKKEQKIPRRIASLSMASYVEILKDINLHKWLKNTLETLPIPSSEKVVTGEIAETKEQIQNILGFIIRTTDADRAKMNQHQKLVKEYLTHTVQGCSELGKMLDTYHSRTLESTRQGIVGRLSQEASRLDQATEELS